MQVLCIDNLTITFTNSYVCHNYYKKNRRNPWLFELFYYINYNEYLCILLRLKHLSSSNLCNITQRKMSATHHGQLTPTITKNLKLLCHNRINHSHRLQIGKQPAQSSARHKQMLHRNHQRTL